MMKKLLLSLLFTTLFNASLIYSLKLNSVTGLPVFFFDLVVIISIALYLYFSKQKITNTLRMYFVLFPLTFFILLYKWIDYNSGLKTEVRFFKFKSKNYELDMNKSEMIYSIKLFQSEDGNSLRTLSYGTYRTEVNGIILHDTEQNKVFNIINDKLIGFPTVGISCDLD